MKTLGKMYLLGDDLKNLLFYSLPLMEDCFFFSDEDRAHLVFLYLRWLLVGGVF